MNTSSFVNSQRQRYAIRWHVKEIYSDRGTDIAAVPTSWTCTLWTLRIYAFIITLTLIRKPPGWFNTTDSLHLGGAWRRLIGTTCSILDSMLQKNRRIKLTHEVFTTFFAKVMAVIYNWLLFPFLQIQNHLKCIIQMFYLHRETGDMFGSHMDFDVCNISLEIHPNTLQHILGPFERRVHLVSTAS